MELLTSQAERDLAIRGLKRIQSDGGLTVARVDALAERCGVDRSTVYRWLTAGESRGSARRTYVLSEEAKVAFFMACGNAKLAHRMLSEETGDEAPSLSTFQRAIRRELDAATIAAARHGASARSQHRVALRDRPYQRNERWEADHTQLEVEVVPPRSRKPIRPWLTWIVDAGTRFVGGWAVSVRPTRGEVLAVIRLAIEDAPERGPMHGYPKMMVWDNGLEFTARAVTDCAVMLGTYAAPTYAYSPQRKPKIERLNQTIERELLATLPYYTKGPRKQDGTLYAPPGGPLTLGLLVEQVALWIDHYNSDRSHSGLEGRTPREAWLADPTPIQKVNPEDVQRFTLERREVTVSHDAGVTIDRRSYVAPELHGYVREKVEVGLMPHDYSRAEIFFEDQWLCTALPATSLTHDQVLEHKARLTELNRESGRLHRKRTMLLRERFAPMTPADPRPRSLPPDPALRGPERRGADRFGFGDEIGEVE